MINTSIFIERITEIWKMFRNFILLLIFIRLRQLLTFREPINCQARLFFFCFPGHLSSWCIIISISMEKSCIFIHFFTHTDKIILRRYRECKLLNPIMIISFFIFFIIIFITLCIVFYPFLVPSFNLHFGFIWKIKAELKWQKNWFVV